MLGGVRQALANQVSVGSQLHDVLAIEIGESKAMRCVDDEVEHRPAQAQAASFSGETPDHLRPSPDDTLFDERGAVKENAVTGRWTARHRTSSSRPAPLPDAEHRGRGWERAAGRW